jgi:hypothetical protein
MRIMVGLALPGLGQPVPPGEPPMLVDDQDSDLPRSTWLAIREEGRSGKLHLPHA